MTATLLIEIGVEELPPRSTLRLADAFAAGIASELHQAGIAHDRVTRYATPRRLAVAIGNTAEGAQPVDIEKAGPTVAIAFAEDGSPTAAAEGFARSLGTTVDALAREPSEKGDRLVYRARHAGRPLAELLQSIVDKTLKSLPIAKLMRWGDGDAAFVRPVHWVVALHGSDIVALHVFGQESNRVTYGHRFHHADAISLAEADEYAGALLDPGHVIADPDARRERVVEQVKRSATELGGRALADAELIEEVTALVEWPAGVAGTFDKRFLELPREVLIATLEGHQRYFPIEDDTGTLMARFVTIANIESRDVAQVIAGNERVIRPRLADALFFWEQDRKKRLGDRIGELARVSFQQELGSLADKSRRVAAIAQRLAVAAYANLGVVERAAELAKTDLLTEMVGEFPELQGVMGRYYALWDQELPAVASALESQYAPARSGAPIAADAAGRVLAIADRLDTLAGIFALNRRPSGDKDPFGLRRAALGVLRTIIEGGIKIDLGEEIDFAIAQQPVVTQDDTAQSLWTFHMERLRGYYAEQKFSVDRFEAVAALGVTDILDFDRRIRALSSFVALDAAAVVCGAHKRIRNLLRQGDDAAAKDFNVQSIEGPAEKALAHALIDTKERVELAHASSDYDSALCALVHLAVPLDAFFDQVMVMSEDMRLRQNRLALLSELDALCRRVADISRLALD